MQGPATVVPEPLELADDVLDAVKLEEMHYTIVTNTLNGAQRVVQGPTLLFPVRVRVRVRIRVRVRVR